MLDDAASEVLDSIRHAFNSFAEGGIKDLYYFQENECWYPKIVLRQVVDIAEIDQHSDLLTIYRGCSKNEFMTQNFGQSWSLKKSVAEGFAYTNYKYQPWFLMSDRLVIEAKITKIGVLLTRLSHHESEIIVNTSLLSNIMRCQGDRTNRSRSRFK